MKSAFPRREHAYKILCALLIAVGICHFDLHYVNFLFFDAQVRLRPTPRTSGNVELVSIDFATVERLGHIPRAGEHLKLAKTLQASHARAIIFLIDPSEIMGSKTELAQLAREFSRLDGLQFAIDDTILKGDRSMLRLPPPFDNVATGMAPETSDKFLFARDEVTRRMFLSYEGEKALELQVAALFNGDLLRPDGVRGSFEYLRSQQAYVDFRPSGTYRTSSFVAVLEGASENARFQNKIILVGRNLNTLAKDYVRTPYSREIEAMTKLELHANIIDTLILNSSPLRLPTWIDGIISFIVGLLGIYSIFSRRPAKGFLILGCTIVGLFAVSLILFAVSGVWFGLAQPVVTTFILFYLVIPYRLVVENRERNRQYQQQAELAEQVSHDIRSPIAALNMVMKGIDGIPLEKSAIILNATTRINDIANNLLQTSKSLAGREGLPVIPTKHPQRVLLSDVVRAIASEKRNQYVELKTIEICNDTSEGYGLFAHVEPSALSRALSNLINNAVEASPSAGVVRISLRANGSFAEISIADQGAGIPADLLKELGKQQVQSNKTGQSGSGVGVLYAQNFANASDGKLHFANSRGTTATLSLPLIDPPFWFAQKIEAESKSTVVSISPIESTHEIWAKRFAESNKTLLKFNTTESFVEWFHAQKTDEALFLVDQDLEDPSRDGLELIARLDIAHQSILVTSRSEEKTVQTRAEYVGVKLLPATELSRVPVHCGVKPKPTMNSFRNRQRLERSVDIEPRDAGTS